MPQYLDFTNYPNWKVYDSKIIFELTNSKYAIDVEIEFNISKNKNKKMIYQTKKMSDFFMEMGNGFVWGWDEEKNKTHYIISKILIDITQNEYLQIIKTIAQNKFKGITIFFEDNTFLQPLTISGNVEFYEKEGNIKDWKYFETFFP
jgi:hypothetical protein